MKQRAGGFFSEKNRSRIKWIIIVLLCVAVIIYLFHSCFFWNAPLNNDSAWESEEPYIYHCSHGDDEWLLLDGERVEIDIRFHRGGLLSILDYPEYAPSFRDWMEIQIDGKSVLKGDYTLTERELVVTVTEDELFEGAYDKLVFLNTDYRDHQERPVQQQPPVYKPGTRY